MMEMKKILAVSVILLFIGVTVAPSINQSIVKASQDHDLVEVHVENCGLSNTQHHTVLLTHNEIAFIEEVIGRVNQKLDKLTTRQESTLIIKDAVEELYPLGLFGKISLEQAKKLVTGEYQGDFLNPLWEKIIRNSQENSNENWFCLVSYRLNPSDDTDGVSSLVIPLWMLFVSGVCPIFFILLFFKAVIGAFSFFSIVNIDGFGFTIKTFGVNGRIDYDMNHYGPVIMFGFTGLRIQYDVEPQDGPSFPYFNKGFMLGFTYSIYQAIYQQNI